MTRLFSRVIQTVDSHTEGNPTRVIVGGVPTPRGSTIQERRDWIQQHDDGLRRLVNFEPRGSDMMCSVLLTPPVEADSDFGLVLMEQDEYVPMCGHCVIGAATTVVATGSVVAVEPVTTVRFDTPAGLVVCEVDVRDGQIGPVTLRNVRSFVLHRDATVSVPGYGAITVDVSFGGDFYVIVDADALGIRLAPEHSAEMVDAARRIIPAVNQQLHISHPDRPEIDRCYETLFTSHATTTGDMKQTIVSPPGALDRSPCGTGTCARLASLHARGVATVGRPLRFEGVLGTCFEGWIESAEMRDGLSVVNPVIRGRAYLTGFHTFLLDPDDPFPAGFRIGPRAREH